MDQKILEIDNLTVEFMTRNGSVTAVENVSFSVKKGETLGVIGESGSGKSVTSLALMRILDTNGKILSGELVYSGVDLKRASNAAMYDIRGREISMIFQNPRGSLNPVRKIGKQLEDVLCQHGLANKYNARKKAIDLLATVKIENPTARFNAYPHELSGGMCQRVVIAIALACQPRLLIADEPTTGLDVTTQKVILDLVKDLTTERGMSMILITHDLGLAANYCDRAIVMEQGKVVESGCINNLFLNPNHPYTKKLIRATPNKSSQLNQLLPSESRSSCISYLQGGHQSASFNHKGREPKNQRPLLYIDRLTKEFPIRNQIFRLPSLMSFGKKPKEVQQVFRAVDNLSMKINYGESVGLVGESGCGKSTTSAMIMRLVDSTEGWIEFDGTDIGSVPAKHFARSPIRSKLQMVFQDPTDCLNPRFTARQSISDPIIVLGSLNSKRSIDKRVDHLADLVGLPKQLLERFPHQLSGGQKARVGIARAIALDPKLLILDEPTAALDVSVQAVVLNLLQELKYQLDMSYLFISHDLNVVRLLCDRVMVMRNGRIVEEGETRKVMVEPSQSYTRDLLNAIPHPPELVSQ